MIRRIQGVLETIEDGAAIVSLPSGLTYEVLLSSYTAGRLAGLIGQPVTLHTIHYLEGSSQGGNMTPRLAGFLDATDRDFFDCFTDVKGIGPRKAMRAMAMSSAQIAAAIADRDVKTLQSLPEIGRRMAETIVATLHGKVDRFLESPSVGRKAGESLAGMAEPSAASGSAAREAMAVLLQLGENRTAVVQWINDVLVKQPDMDNAQELITAVLRHKATL